MFLAVMSPILKEIFERDTNRNKAAIPNERKFFLYLFLQIYSFFYKLMYCRNDTTRKHPCVQTPL